MQDVLEKMTLIEDPEWPVHRVVMTTLYFDANVERSMALLGILEGAQKVTLSKDSAPAAWWSVVAPSEEQAVRWAREAVEDLAPHSVDLNTIRVDNSYPRN